MNKKIMLIGVGWEQLPLVSKAKQKGLYVIATTSWNADIPADRIYQADSRDLDRLEQIFLDEKPDAVLADECDYSMYAVAYLTQKYNLPGPSLEALTITNNKYLQRQCAEKCGVLQPDYQMCYSCAQAEEFADKIGYPIIIKPVDNRGSIGVTVVKSPLELPAAWYEAVKNSHSRLCLAEKFIDGDVVTVDGYCSDGDFRFLSAGTKDTYDNTPTVAKALYYPGLLSKTQLEVLKLCAAAIIGQTKISFGFTHVEFLLDKKTKEFYFLEIANRGGGVYISNVILPYITGVDLMDTYIDHALGKESSLSCVSSGKAFMFFLSPKGNKNAVDILQQNSNDILAAHIRPWDEKSAVKDASGRIGVIIFKGTDFEYMKSLACSLEDSIGYAQSEYITFK